MELRTRENYTYYLDRRIIPEFGPMRMVEILPAHVREWVTKLTQEGVRPQYYSCGFSVCGRAATQRDLRRC